jgi:hypothetical protein
MKLRIYRQWTWELNYSPMEIRYGRSNPMKLVAYDELQYFYHGKWYPIEVVGAPKPKQPGEIVWAE